MEKQSEINKVQEQISEIQESDNSIDNLTEEELRESLLEHQEVLAALVEEIERDDSSIENLENSLFQERYVYIHDGIDQDTLSQVSTLIDYWNMRDEGIPVEERQGITIKIGTYGGEAYEALAIVDSIESSVTPVHIHVEGKAMSAGFIIWAAGHTRTMGKRSILMYHQLNGQVSGTFTEMVRALEELRRVQKTIDDLVVERLGISPKKLKKINSSNIDWFIDYHEAIKMNLITTVVEDKE